MDIPGDAYWGVHSARAVDNFPISGQTVATMPEMVRALAFVKKAAARANAQLGVIDATRARAIERACDDLIGGSVMVCPACGDVSTRQRTAELELLEVS